jgi:2-iminoacetate synthase
MINSPDTISVQKDFSSVFERYEWDQVFWNVHSKTAADVERALAKPRRDLEDFAALISPAAAPYLEQMARLSQEITLRRFGRTIQLYAPLYLSNECQNICTYCGFSQDNDLERKTLNAAEILREIEALKSMGYEHVLLVTGEANKTVGMDYFRKAFTLIRPHFSQLSLEVQPLEEEDYRELASLGLHSVLVYQETYRRETYKIHHPKGRKSNFSYRLETPDRLGRAGVHKIGLGVLVGLEDWRTDSFFNALHLRYLSRTYWRTKYSISFPRLRPHAGGVTPKSVMSDRELVQLMCAYRLLDPDVELSISTRESEHFRNHVIPLGVTTFSAGSKTNPGGYACEPESLEQFEISDERSPGQIAAVIRAAGYEPVWKDWDRGYRAS